MILIYYKIIDTINWHSWQLYISNREDIRIRIRIRTIRFVFVSDKIRIRIRIHYIHRWFSSHLVSIWRNPLVSLPSQPKCLTEKIKIKYPQAPKVFSLNPLFHFTRQWPPFASSVPFHKKLLLNLFIFIMAHFWSLETARK